MTKKELLKALSRYPDDAVIGVINMNGSFCDGDIAIDFFIQSKSKTAKYNAGAGFEDAFDECRAFIVV